MNPTQIAARNLHLNLNLGLDLDSTLTNTLVDEEAAAPLPPNEYDQAGTVSTFVTISSLAFVLYSQFVDFSLGAWLVFFGTQGLLVARFRLLDKSAAHTLLPTRVDPVHLRLMLHDRDFDGRDYESLLALDGDNPFGAQRAARADQVDSLPKTVVACMPGPADTEQTATAAPVHSENITENREQASAFLEDAERNSSSSNSSSLASLTALSCCICLDEFAVGHVVKTLPCAHQFHADCVDQWLRLHAVCPICKRPLPRL